MENKEITYILKRETTCQQTGFFIAVPDEDLSLNEALVLLTHRPQDDFLHQYILKQISLIPLETLKQFLDRCEADANPLHQVLAAEYLFLTKGREHLEKRYSVGKIRELNRHTPLIYLRSFLEPDQVLHAQWTAFFRANLQQQKPLPSPNEIGLSALVFEITPVQPEITIAELAESFTRGAPESTAITPVRTADMAEDRLQKAGITLGPLMRHASSLSPIGLLRTWRFASSVENHRNRFSLYGEQTSYGRGITLDTARASLMMEIVERCSAFASVSEQDLENYQKNYRLRCASFSELEKNNADGVKAVNPSNLALEVSYQDQPLHWVCGETPIPDQNKTSNGSRPVWVPVQCLFLFCNLDEPALFSGLGSTGTASGNTLAQAKVAALLEIVERHQTATVPYDLSTCFQLAAQDARVAALLEAFHQANINLWFQDITPADGIPCCRCFVVEKTGSVHIGAAAHLDARRAIVSVITENTCPFPDPPHLQPAPSNLALVGYENLPDYSTGDDATDLALLESLFLRNHWQPCYVDLTRADIGLPVVKAIVPGKEALGDFDEYSRVHPELYHNYLSGRGVF